MELSHDEESDEWNYVDNSAFARSPLAGTGGVDEYFPLSDAEPEEQDVWPVGQSNELNTGGDGGDEKARLSPEEREIDARQDSDFEVGLL